MSSLDYWRNEWEKVTETDELFDVSNDNEADLSERPSWSDVYEGYPKDDTGDDLPAIKVFEMILKKPIDEIFKNACATRVSLGLLNGGVTLKKEFNVQIGKFAGKGFIASAEKLKNFLSKNTVWGNADEIIAGKTSLIKVQNTINGRNGVYIILGGFSAGVSGHSTLWVGANNDVIGGHNYIDYGGTIYFWELI